MKTHTALDRQNRIMALLQEHETLQIGELAGTLRVSPMTVHRDLHRLASQGKLRKIHGGATLAPAFGEREGSCCFCLMPLPAESHTRAVLHLADGSRRVACCPHCGLLSAHHLGDQIVSVLVTDFLYGRVAAAQAATYVIGADVQSCCTPATLAFTAAQDAARFQIGFGGRTLSLAEATQHLVATMGLNPHGRHQAPAR